MKNASRWFCCSVLLALFSCHQCEDSSCPVGALCDGEECVCICNLEGEWTLVQSSYVDNLVEETGILSLDADGNGFMEIERQTGTWAGLSYFDIESSSCEEFLLEGGHVYTIGDSLGFDDSYSQYHRFIPVEGDCTQLEVTLSTIEGSQENRRPWIFELN